MQTELQHNDRPVNIILVEDDDGDAKAMIRAFKKVHISNPIMRLIDGVDALKLLRSDMAPSEPFILLVDLNMPRMSGIELLKELRQDPRLKQLIAFMLTTSSSEADKAAAYELNVAGYIVKATAGRDFLQLFNLLDCYWRIVEIPEICRSAGHA